VGPTTVDDYRTGDKKVVVVLPGVYETWHFLRPLMWTFTSVIRATRGSADRTGARTGC
jgi:hypothetical protein